MKTNGESADTVFEVTVRHNLVQSIHRAPRTPDMHVPASRLEVSTELATNHQRNQCIDGVYRFEDAEQARSFSVLALDFVNRIIERRLQTIQAPDSGAEFDADAVNVPHG